MGGAAWLVGVGLLALVTGTEAVASPSSPGAPANAGRAPVDGRRFRESKLRLDRYGRELVIVRERSAGKKSAAFVAEPVLLDPSTQMVFEARSEARTGASVRWRCIATRDVAECLGSTLRISYLPGDERVVLVARIEPRASRGEEVALAR